MARQSTHFGWRGEDYRGILAGTITNRVDFSTCCWSMGAREMLGRLRAWRVERRRKEAAIRRALQEFRDKRGFAAVGAHVLRLDPEETIVRVMYLTNHIPLDRAWFAISNTTGVVRELAFHDVANLESPWR